MNTDSNMPTNSSGKSQTPPPDTSSDERSNAMLAWLLGLFLGVFGPLIIYLLKKDESKFVVYRSMQSLYLNLVSIPLILITCGLWAIPLMIFEILWAIKANNGEWTPMPVVGDWAWPVEFSRPENSPSNQ